MSPVEQDIDDVPKPPSDPMSCGSCVQEDGVVRVLDSVDAPPDSIPEPLFVDGHFSTDGTGLSGPNTIRA